MEVMATRCFFSFFLAGVIFASTIFPASAWGKDSFISGGEEYESSVDVALSDDLLAPDVYAAPRRAPRMFKASASEQAAAEANTTGKLVVPATLPTSVDGTFQVMSKYYLYRPAQSTPPLPKFKSDYWRDVVVSYSNPVPWSSGSFIFYGNFPAFSYSADVSNPNEMVRGLAAFCNKDKAIFPNGNFVTGSTSDVGTDSWSFVTNYDVSAYGSSAFSLDGLFSVQFGSNGPYFNGWKFIYPSSVDVLVDGMQVLSLSRGSSNSFDFGGYVFSGSSNVSTISFRWHFPFSYFVSNSSAYDGTYYFELRSFIGISDPAALAISFLDGQDVINAQNNKTKDDINKHEELESQWVGSMTENFNKLDIGNFTFHSGLIAGFAMVSGLFMDIWRGMGDAAIAYVFPLTLGVVLVLLGRISRFGGKRGTEEGDDSS